MPLESSLALEQSWPYCACAVWLQAMICVEWWCFEAIILLAGRLPQPEVAIDIVGICVNVATTTFMIPFGLSGQLVAL